MITFKEKIIEEKDDTVKNIQENLKKERESIQLIKQENEKESKRYKGKFYKFMIFSSSKFS